MSGSGLQRNALTVVGCALPSTPEVVTHTADRPNVNQTQLLADRAGKLREAESTASRAFTSPGRPLRGKVANTRTLASIIAGVMLALGLAGPTFARVWKPLVEDGIHDRNNFALRLLQEPQKALQELPPATEGDQVDWVEAVEKLRINPRVSMSGEPKSVLDLNVVMKRTGTMSHVRFSHRIHTDWLDCSSCHDEIFEAKIGANARGLAHAVLGNGCGRCHGTVAFPMERCGRCHSVPLR